MGDLFVVKIGGETLNSAASLSKCIEAVAASGKKVVLVHGGGKKVTELAGKLGVKQEIVEGRRITSAETLELCTMVYGGLISKNLVVQLAAKAKTAVGISGADFNAIRSRKRENANIDYGFVGDVEHVSAHVFKDFIEKDIIPVVNSITMGQNFELLNTNADTLAAEIAMSLVSSYKVHLVYCFEKNGVLMDVSDDDSTISELTQQHFTSLKKSGHIADGMLPKLQTAYRALFHGIVEAKIIHSNYLKNYFDGENTGTNVKLH